MRLLAVGLKGNPKKALAVAAVILLAWVGIGKAAQVREVPVGVLLPLTGSLAEFGRNSLNGLQMTAELINQSGGIRRLDGAKVRLVVQDSTSDPSTAASVAQRLISREKVVAVLGAYASSLSLTVSEVTERAQIPFLTMSFTDLLTTRGYRYIFQIVPKASAIGDAQLTYAIALSKAVGRPIKRVAILHEDTAYGTSQAEGLVRAAQQRGVSVVLDEAYPPNITDAIPLVNKVRMAHPDALFPLSYFTDAVLIIRALRQQGVAIPVFGGAGGFVIPAFKKALGELANGVFSVTTSNYDHYGQWGQQYRTRFGEPATHEAYEHAALLYTLVDAINATGSLDGRVLADALRHRVFTGPQYGGLPGRAVHYDETGLNRVAYPILVQWQGGELVTVWPSTDATRKPLWPSQ